MNINLNFTLEAFFSQVNIYLFMLDPGYLEHIIINFIYKRISLATWIYSNLHFFHSNHLFVTYIITFDYSAPHFDQC